jgi:hypothetical protein
MHQGHRGLAAVLLGVGLTTLLGLPVAGYRPTIAGAEFGPTAAAIGALACTAVGAWLFLGPIQIDRRLKTYEACHRSLDLVVAILNLVKRGDPDNFGATVPPRLAAAGVKRPPQHLDAYRNLPAASKVEYLGELPGWYREWPQVLDKSLRNAIGHHSVHHHLASGTLQRDNGPDVPYIQFAANVQQLLHPLLTMLNVVKLVRIGSST